MHVRAACAARAEKARRGIAPAGLFCAMGFFLAWWGFLFCAHGPRLRAFLCSGRALPKAHAYPSDLYRLFGHAC